MADKNLVLQLLITAKDQASAALRGIGASVKTMGDAVSQVLAPLRTFGGLLATAAGIGGAKELADRADAYIRVSNSLKIATTSEEAYQAALQDVAAIAARTNADIETTAQLYGKVAQSAKELGLSQTQVGQLTEVISKGMQLSGASAATASGAILQLTQAFGSGALRGEEFNSVMEASPELMRQLAAGLGVTIGELRGLAEQGALTSRAVSAALLAQKDAIDKAYGETTRTVEQSFTALNNQLILYVGKLNESTAATATIGSALKLLGDNLNVVAAAAGAGLAAALGKSTQALISYAKESIAARAAAREHAIAAAAQREAALAAAQGNLAAAQAAANRALAEQRAAHAALQAAWAAAATAKADQSVVQARAAVTASAQAATAATNRYIAAQAALNAAQAATTTSAGFMARAFSFLMRPGGLILAAVSAFGLLLPMLSSNKTATDALSGSLDEYAEALKKATAAQIEAQRQKLDLEINKQKTEIDDLVVSVQNQVRWLDQVKKANGNVASATDELNRRQAALDTATQNLNALTERRNALLNEQENRSKALSAEDARALVQYQRTILAMQQYAKDLDALGKQQKAVASATQERIQAELDLAKAAGDVQAVDRLTLELANARAAAARQQAELDRAAAVAATLKLEAVQKEYNLILQKQPKDEEGLRLAKQDAELKNAQAAASAALAAKLQQQARDTDALALATQTLETRLAALREETEQELARAEQQARVQSEQIQGALELAKAKGDEAEAARIVADATEQEIATAEQRIVLLREQQAEIDRHIQKLYAQFNADQDYTESERAVIEALKDKSAALDADIATIEAHLPLMEREAQQADIMTGPIGQLSRLYAEQTREHEQAASAAERYYDTQIKEVDAAIRVAQAKGDEAEAADLLLQKRDLEIEQAETMSALKAQEAVDAQNAVEVKKLEAAASEGVSEAEQIEIDKLQELADAKKTAAQQAEIHADALRKEKDAAESSSDAFDNAAKNAYKFSDAAGDVAKRNAEVGKSADDAAQKTESLTSSFIKFRGEVANAVDFRGIGQFNELFNQVKNRIEEANLAAQRLANEGIAAAGTNTAWLAKDLLEVEGALSDAAHTAGNQLVDALVQARQEAEEMSESLKDMAADFRREILQIQGDQATLLELEHQENLQRLEELHQRAGQLGDDEYNEALRQANALHELKMRQLQEEANRDRDTTGNAVNNANDVRDAWGKAAAEVERAAVGISRIGAADLSGLNNQLADTAQAAAALRMAL
ncbi:MAG: tape measure protein [Candidatus Contendobacter sp.]|nr:tape measure protein [Candidatus Contendobacter sp.]